MLLAILYCFVVGIGLAQEKSGSVDILAVWYKHPLLALPLVYLLFQIPLAFQKRRMPTWSSWVTLIVVIGLLGQAMNRIGEKPKGNRSHSSLPIAAPPQIAFPTENPMQEPKKTEPNGFTLGNLKLENFQPKTHKLFGQVLEFTLANNHQKLTAVRVSFRATFFGKDGEVLHTEDYFATADKGAYLPDLGESKPESIPPGHTKQVIVGIVKWPSGADKVGVKLLSAGTKE